MANGILKPASLDSLRRRIDALDDKIQDLVIERSEIVEQVAQAKQGDNLPPFRPGREAQIVRRLVGRHRGRFPRPALVRIWREILGGSIAMQTELAVAFTNGCGDLARDHFGSQAPMIDLPSAAEVITAIREGSAGVGVVPLVEDDSDRDPWWLALSDLGEDRPRVIARLPFGTCGNAERFQEAFVIAALEPEASGDDCTLFAIRAPAPLPAAQITDAFLAERLDCTPTAQAERDDGSVALVEVEAMLAARDPRVLRALKPLGTGLGTVWLGAYARPLPDESLDGIAPD